MPNASFIEATLFHIGLNLLDIEELRKLQRNNCLLSQYFPQKKSLSTFLLSIAITLNAVLFSILVALKYKNERIKVRRFIYIEKK